MNFVTKQAPEVGKLTGNLEWGYNDLRSTNNPKASVTWGRRFSQKRLGMIFSGSAQDESRANETTEDEYTVTQQLNRVTFRDEYSNYQRYSANAAVDWLASNYTFTVRLTWTRQDQDKVRRRQRDENIPTGITGTGGRIRTELRDRTRRRDVFTNSLGGTVLFKNEWAADYSFVYNESDRGEPNTALNRYQQSGIRYAPFVDPEGRVGVHQSQSPELRPDQGDVVVQPDRATVHQRPRHHRGLQSSDSARLRLHEIRGQGPRQAEDQ